MVYSIGESIDYDVKNHGPGYMNFRKPGRWCSDMPTSAWTAKAGQLKMVEKWNSEIVTVEVFLMFRAGKT